MEVSRLVLHRAAPWIEPPSSQAKCWNPVCWWVLFNVAVMRSSDSATLQHDKAMRVQLQLCKWHPVGIKVTSMSDCLDPLREPLHVGNNSCLILRLFARSAGPCILSAGTHNIFYVSSYPTCSSSLRGSRQSDMDATLIPTGCHLQSCSCTLIGLPGQLLFLHRFQTRDV